MGLVREERRARRMASVSGRVAPAGEPTHCGPMSRWVAVASILVFLFAVGCGEANRDGGDSSIGGRVDSGIAGTVVAGPGCPVGQEGTPCPGQPVRARLSVRVGPSDKRVPGARGVVVAKGRSNDEGRFRIAVPPGDYVVDQYRLRVLAESDPRDAGAPTGGGVHLLVRDPGPPSGGAPGNGRGVERHR
jgi:hypothetical protein